MAKQIGIVNLGGEYLVAEDAKFLIGELATGEDVFVAGPPRGTARRVAEALGGKDQVFLVCALAENEKGPQPFRVVEPEQVLGVAESFGSRNMLPAALPGRFEGWIKLISDRKLASVKIPDSDKPAAATPDPAPAPAPTTPPTALGAALGKAGMKGSEEPATEPEQSVLMDSAAAARVVAEGIKALRPITCSLVVTVQEREALQETIGARFPRAAFDPAQAESAQANMERVLQDVQQRRRQAAEIFFAELASFCEGNMALQLGVLGGDLPTLNEKGNPTWGSTLEELLAPVVDDQGTKPPPDGDKPEGEPEVVAPEGEEQGVHSIAEAAAAAGAAAQEGGVKAEEAAPATTKKPPTPRRRKTAAEKAAEKAATGTDG